jgi:dienelactone hydrolase
MRWARSSRRALARLAAFLAGGALLAASLLGPGTVWAAQATAIFPSDRFTVADPAQLTGRRVALMMPSCPTDPSGCDDVTLLNQLDGFSVNPRVAVSFDAPIKVESVTRETAFLMPLTAEPGGGGPIGLGQLVWDPEGKVLYARPERVLLQSRIYALVVTTRVLDAEDKRLRPAPEFLKPREGTGHDRKVETQMWKALAPTRLKWADIAGIALFTTQSVTADLERMRAVLETRAPPALTFDLAPGGAASVWPRAALQSIEFRRQVATSGMLLGDPIPLELNLLPATEVRTIALGRYRSPSFLTADRHILQVPTRQAMPVPTVEEEIHLTLFLPEGNRPAGGWPVAIFGHGFTNDRNVIPPSVAGTLARAGFATIAINVVGHGAGHDGTLIVTPAAGPSIVLPSGGRGLDLNDDGQIGLSEGVGTRTGTAFQPIASRDGLKQTVADLIQLVRAIRRGIDVDGDGQPDLDRDRIYYVGQSFGGMYGTLLMAVEPRIRAGVLNVPGGPVIEIARQAAAFRPSVITGLQSRNPALMNGEKDFVEAIPLPGEPAVKAPPAGALDIQDYFDRVEWLGQSANPVAFAPYLVRAPLGGGAARPVLYQWAVGDRTVPNPTTESLLRAGDLLRVSSLYRHDQVAASLPERFRANPHGFLTWTYFPDVADIARAAQEQVVKFFLSDGQKIEQVDPRFELAAPRP